MVTESGIVLLYSVFCAVGACAYINGQQGVIDFGPGGGASITGADEGVLLVALERGWVNRNGAWLCPFCQTWDPKKKATLRLPTEVLNRLARTPKAINHAFFDRVTVTNA